MHSYIELVIKIQTNMRGFLARKKYQRLKKSMQVNAFQPHLYYQGDINDLNDAPFEPQGVAKVSFFNIIRLTENTRK
jgi:hypothetical protein